jgi:hypothetical protein
MISSSKHHQPNTTNTSAKSTIIQRIDGERDFGFVILSLVDRLLFSSLLA